jgi:predicted TIM-barrel fold metal-dependent hydrolase
MLIDIHNHATPRRTPATELWTGGYWFQLPHELIALMDRAGIDKTVVLCVMSPEAQNLYLTPDEALEMCALYPNRLIPSCSLDGRMGNFDAKSDYRRRLQYYKDAGCKIVGEYMTNLPFDDPIQMNVFKQVEEVGLPLTFHLGATQGGCYGCYDDKNLPRLEKVLRKCPNLKLFGHSQAFWSEIGQVTEKSRAGWPTGKVKPGAVVRLMREYPNLHGDLSAGSGFGAISRDPEFGYRFMEEFQDRLLFGTDICYTPIKNLFKDFGIIKYFQKLKKEKLISTEAWEATTCSARSDSAGAATAKPSSPTWTGSCAACARGRGPGCSCSTQRIPSVPPAPICAPTAPAATKKPLLASAPKTAQSSDDWT